MYVRRRLELNGNAVCGRKRIRTGIKRSEYCSAVFILVAELLLRFTSAARERSHHVHSRPRRKLTLYIDAEGLVTHEQPVGLRPRHFGRLSAATIITLCSLRGLVLPSRELFNYVDNVVLEVGSISQ